jgi:leucyl aminopeptidase (aminopeptidase T)
LNWELKKAAKVIIEQMVNLKEGEDILIYADTAADHQVVESLAEAAYLAGGVISLFKYETRPEVGIEPPGPLSAAMKEADVIIELAEKYLIHTKAYHKALESGSRNLCLTGMTPQMMIRCIGDINYPKMVELGDALADLLQEGEEMQITTPAGTELYCRIKGRPVFHNSGVISKPGEQSFLGGQVSWAPIEESINGTMVFDGSVWPPEELGLLKGPIVLKVEKGGIKAIEGGGEAKTLEGWLESFDDPKMFKIAHFSYGFNPGAKLSGKILEDERVFGCIEIGLGSQRPRFKGTVGPAKAHTDGVMLNPTVKLDGELIEEEGEFIHPKLARIAKALR